MRNSSRLAVLIASQSTGSVYKPFKHTVRPVLLEHVIAHMLDHVPYGDALDIFVSLNGDGYERVLERYRDEPRVHISVQTQPMLQMDHIRALLDEHGEVFETKYDWLVMNDDDDFMAPAYPRLLFEQVPPDTDVVMYPLTVFDFGSYYHMGHLDMALQSILGGKFTHVDLCTQARLAKQMYGYETTKEHGDWSGTAWRLASLRAALAYIDEIEMTGPCQDVAMRLWALANTSPPRLYVMTPEPNDPYSLYFMTIDKLDYIGCALRRKEE